MKKLICCSLLMLAAAACSSGEGMPDGVAGQSSLTSIKVSGGKLTDGYKMLGNFELSVESVDGDFIKNASGTMTKSLNASLADGGSLSVSVTKNKSYKFTMTGSIAKGDSNSNPVKKVKSCPASLQPILVNQDNQVIGIRLCDETNAPVSTVTDVTNVTIETTYTPSESASTPSSIPATAPVNNNAAPVNNNAAPAVSRSSIL